jgi:hypothetical protein
MYVERSIRERECGCVHDAYSMLHVTSKQHIDAHLGDDDEVWHERYALHFTEVKTDHKLLSDVAQRSHSASMPAD